MATVETFGPLNFRTITPDEIAALAKTSILYGLTLNEDDAVLVRDDVRNVLPVLKPKHKALLVGLLTGVSLSLGWQLLRAELLPLSKN